MSRGISDPIQPPVQQEEQAEITNEEVMQFLDEVAMMVRDIDTRLSTLERNLLAPHAAQIAPEQQSKKRFLNGK